MTSIDQFPTPFREGDNVVLLEATCRGTPGVFLRLRADPKWADVTEPDGIVRTHPFEWLAHSSLANEGGTDI
jgi:hypothetical protein